MAQPLVTVIIPVYNIEPYLERCLKSVLVQTYKNLEIIAVNDGSTDDSLEILKKYALKDGRLKIANQKNLGLSAARNRGLKFATGEYICFINGDDSIAPRYIAELMSNLTRAKADIAISGYTIIPKGPKKEISPKPEVLSGRNATIRLLSSHEPTDVVTWNKIYKKSLFFDHKIAFPPTETHPDEFIGYKIYSHAKKVVYSQKPLYQHYEGDHPNKKNLLSRLRSREQAAREAIDYFASAKDLKSAANVSLLLAYFAYLDAAIEKKIGKTHATRALRFISSRRPYYRHNRYVTLKLHLYLALTFTPGAFAYKLFRKITKLVNKLTSGA